MSIGYLNRSFITLFIKLLNNILQWLRNFVHTLLDLFFDLVEPFEHLNEIRLRSDEIYWLLVGVTAIKLLFRASGAAHSEKKIHDMSYLRPFFRLQQNYILILDAFEINLNE